MFLGRHFSVGAVSPACCSTGGPTVGQNYVCWAHVCLNALRDLAFTPECTENSVA